MDRPPPSYVYAIRAGNYVKIGKSDNPKGRIDGFRTGCPHRISVISVIELWDSRAALAYESGLHHYFSVAGLRHNREWFVWTPQLEADILGCGTTYYGSPIDGLDGSSDFDSMCCSYIAGTVGKSISDAKAPFYYTDGPAEHVIEYRIGYCYDNLSQTERYGYVEVLSPIFMGEHPKDYVILVAFANDHGDYFEIHTSGGAMIRMPKSYQARIATLLSSTTNG